MNTPAARQAVPRRGTASHQPALSQDLTQGRGAALKVVFVDDEADFLQMLELTSQNHRAIDLKTLGLTEHNHLLPALAGWVQQGWSPDLLCIDLNEAHGKGVAGMDYLRLLRNQPEWKKTPIVLTTKSRDVEPKDLERRTESDFVHKVYATGADGYLLGKDSSQDFLDGLLLQWPSWHHHARTRLWQDMLEESRQVFQRVRDEQALQTALDQYLAVLCQRLDIDHAFIRRGPPESCPMWAKYKGDWANQAVVTCLTDIPLLKRVISNKGTVTPMAQISAEQAGPFPALVGKAYMGCALMHDTSLLGVMTLVCDQPRRFGALDQGFFQRLADQVSHAFAESFLRAQSQKMRQALLAFSEALATTDTEAGVCQALAEVAHQVVHDGMEDAKCTVRLVEPGYPVLRRYGQAGKVAQGTDISLKPDTQGKDSMYRHAVLHCTTVAAHNPAELTANNYLNNNRDAKGQPWWVSQTAITVPLAWERPDSQEGAPQQSALGAVNLECAQAGHYAEPEVRGFLISLALSASHRLAAIRSARFAAAALDLAVDAYDLRTDDLWQRLHQALFTLLGHNQLIQLASPQAWDGHSTTKPWQVQRVFSIDPERYTADVARWNQHFQGDDWPQTFTRQCIEHFVRHPESPPRFTANQKEFVQTTDLLSGETLLANAVMPLWGRASSASAARLSGVVLLSWFNPPGMNRDMFEQVLGHFTDYGSRLLQHSAELVTGSERLRRAEAQASIAFAARQFEHVLNNRLAALQGTAEAGLMDGSLASAQDALTSIRTQVAALDERAQKAALYLKEPKMDWVQVTTVWDQVTNDLQHKALRNAVTVYGWGEGIGDKPLGDLHVYTDENYLWNALYVLLDNAMDALSQQAGRRLVWLNTGTHGQGQPTLALCDNGPGVAQPSKLFQWGETTKAGGQGVALALARERMQRAGAELVYAPAKDCTCFELIFATADRPI